MAVIAASLIVAWFATALLFRARLAPVGIGAGASAQFLLAPPASRRAAPAPASAPPPRHHPGPAWPIQLSDVLLPGSLVLWGLSLRMVDTRAVDDWGLLHALPVTFFVALGLLVVSIAAAVTRPRPSALRLALHLVALVVMLHATVPLLFPEPNYPWVYKHIGVTDYINAHGALNPSVDIYQNWPGFFALAAWFTRIAGLSSPLTIAKWAPVFFNLLFCVELAFALRWLPLRRRERWVALFLVVAANWVGQDYFAPQALAFVLSLAAYAMVLAWMRADASPRPVRLLRQAAAWSTRAGPAVDDWPARPAPLAGGRRAVALAALISLYAVLVVVHQLSPFLVLFGLAFLWVAGLIRPRWVVAVLVAVALGYLAVHLAYLRSEGHLAGSPFNPRQLLAALSNPFDNAHSSGFDATHPMPGRQITALGAPALILGLWVLGAVGAFRRLRAGRPVLVLAALAASPALVALGENYGGEAIFRIYLFSLPWTAALVASALGVGRLRRGGWAAARIAVVLAGVVTLFLGAFYGSVELYRVRPGAVAASEYFFAHAPPGSALGLTSPNVPGRIAANYDQFISGSAPPPLSSVKELQDHLLGRADVAVIEGLYREHRLATPGSLFLSMSTDQATYVHVLGLMPDGALAALDQTLAHSVNWRLFYRNADAAIYEFVGR